MAYWPTSTSADWLYTYGPTGGLPTGWNDAHPLVAAHKATLSHLGVSEQARTTSPNPFFRPNAFPAGVPGGLENTPAAIDYTNPLYPRMGTRVSRDLFLFCMHFWASNLEHRLRPAVNDLWGVPLCRSLQIDGSLRSYANADFLGPWNRLPGPVQIAMRDCGLTEWTVGSPDDPGGYPEILRIDTVPAIDQPAWLIENQGRAIPVNIASLKGTGTASFNKVITVEPPVGCSLFGGDSGGPIMVERDGKLMLWGHVLTINVQPPYGYKEWPDLATIDDYAEPPTLTAPPVTWAIATQTSLDDLRAAVMALSDGVAGI
jgi:hypothetical protein